MFSWLFKIRCWFGWHKLETKQEFTYIQARDPFKAFEAVSIDNGIARLLDLKTSKVGITQGDLKPGEYGFVGTGVYQECSMCKRVLMGAKFKASNITNYAQKL